MFRHKRAKKPEVDLNMCTNYGNTSLFFVKNNQWADVAESDLGEIIAYIAIDSPSNALKVLQKIKRRLAVETTIISIIVAPPFPAYLLEHSTGIRAYSFSLENDILGNTSTC
jgi:hypothetical protein